MRTNPVNKHLYTWFIANICFPIHEFFKRHHTVSIRRELEITQWWNKGQIEQLQLSKLKRLLIHAKANVPYYQKIMRDLAIEPEQFESLAALSKLPLLNKAAIRTNIESLKSLNAQSLVRSNTGGSSGEPLIFYLGKERVSHDVAAKWRATRWWNVDIGDPEIVIWGSPIELGTQDNIRALRDSLFRSKLLPAFEMSDQKLQIFLDEIRSFQPKILFGYPSALSFIARYAEKTGELMNDLGIKVAFVTSERLYDEQRQQISKTFNCPVANGYGGRDAGFIAHECPAGGMHITAEDVIVEILDNQGTPVPCGESGEIVITHLASSDFPFIRYRTGDIGKLDDQLCSCGRGLPLLKEIEGRSTDFVVAQDGTVMHGLALIYILRKIPEINAFKIIQENLDLTRILIVSKSALDGATIKLITNEFQTRLGNDITIKIEEVNEIPLEKSGKFRYVISKVIPP